jgi:hypothetical protein
MQMIVAPGESRLKDVVELGKSDVAADQQASPDQGANAAEGNPQLIDMGWYNRLGLIHWDSLAAAPPTHPPEWNALLSRRFVKKQQMHWTLRGAHLLLQTRTKVLNNELEEVFRRWYPLFRVQAKAA